MSEFYVSEKGVLYNNDYENVLDSLEDESIDLIITDPPFLHIKGGMKNKRYNNGKMASDNFINTKMIDFGKDKIYYLLDNTKRLFKNKSYNGYFFCSKLQIPYYLNWCLDNKYNFDLLIWDRDKKVMISTKFFASNIDYIIRIYGKGRALKNIGQVENKTSYYQKIKKEKQPNNFGHPTEKPMSIIKELMLVSSEEHQTILDPFSGSGTIAEVCEQLNRHYVCIEKEDKYCDIIVERLKKETHNI